MSDLFLVSSGLFSLTPISSQRGALHVSECQGNCTCNAIQRPLLYCVYRPVIHINHHVSVPGRYVEPLPEPIEATIRLEVVRACGLQDAVKAADSWAGGEPSLAMPHQLRGVCLKMRYSSQFLCILQRTCSAPPAILTGPKGSHTSRVLLFHAPAQRGKA